MILYLMANKSRSLARSKMFPCHEIVQGRRRKKYLRGIRCSDKLPEITPEIVYGEKIEGGGNKEQCLYRGRSMMSQFPFMTPFTQFSHLFPRDIRSIDQMLLLAETANNISDIDLIYLSTHDRKSRIILLRPSSPLARSLIA